MWILDTLFPRRCFLCWARTTRASHLCAECEHELPILPQVCLKCAIRIKQRSKLCQRCTKNAPAFDDVLACYAYQNPITRWITGFKFYEKFNYTHVFIDALLKKVTPHPRPDCIVPLPLHPKRLKERGFNQAIVIAVPVAHALNCPLIRHDVHRVIDTLPQRSLKARARAKNVTDAFATSRRFDNLRVAIIDDVMTTGETANALARTLKNAGAKTVEVWCIARVMRGKVDENTNNRYITLP